MATIRFNSSEYTFDLGDPLDISIALRFNGPQPNAYGVDPAVSTPCEYGKLVGDTRRGGSCNFEQITLIPHCNGTHTECVGHITDKRISVNECLRDVLMTARLVSVEPELCNGDTAITRSKLEKAGVGSAARADSLIVRTLPNDDGKLSARYDENNIPTYFSTEAMELIVECGFRHLLVDLPSIDRIFDDGKLLNHRIFWNVPPGVRDLNSETRVGSTITELIFVPSHVTDGEYLLNLQIAPFVADSSPSRPLLFKIERN
ncbi:MAG: cyclase family protein [Pyrinomonadaceae bacterium]